MTTSTELLVARILHPLDRSLEEARRKLALEADEPPDDEDGRHPVRPVTGPFPAPSSSTSSWHGSAAQAARATRPMVSDAPASARAEAAPSTIPHLLSLDAGTSASKEHHDLAGTPAHNPETNTHSAPRHGSPSMPLPPPANHKPLLLHPIADATGPGVAHPGGAHATAPRSSPTLTPQPSSTGTGTTANAPVTSHPTHKAPFFLRSVPPTPFAPDIPAAASQAPALAPGELAPAGGFTPVPGAGQAAPSAQPAQATASVLSVNMPTRGTSGRWRLNKHADGALSGPAAERPSPPANTDIPQQPRGTAPPFDAGSRSTAPGRVADALEPVLDKAWQLTDAGLRQDQGIDPAAPMPGGPRVNNHFHVSVALAGDGAAPRDAQELETALVALLRDAARRQGLDV